jgi:tetratricopeptide (TPR) repeat protein
MIMRKRKGERGADAGETMLTVHLGKLYDAAFFRDEGIRFYESGNFVEALPPFQQALAILREVGDRSGEAGILSNLGSVYLGLKRMREATQHTKEALNIAQELGDRETEQNALHQLGEICLVSKEPREALEFYKQALAVATEEKNQEAQADELVSMGMCYHQLERYEDGIRCLQTALTIYDQTQNERLGHALAGLVICYRALGRAEEAASYYEAYLALGPE